MLLPPDSSAPSDDAVGKSLLLELCHPSASLMPCPVLVLYFPFCSWTFLLSILKGFFPHASLLFHIGGFLFPLTQLLTQVCIFSTRFSPAPPHPPHPQVQGLPGIYHLKVPQAPLTETLKSKLLFVTSYFLLQTLTQELGVTINEREMRKSIEITYTWQNTKISFMSTDCN